MEKFAELLRTFPLWSWIILVILVIGGLEVVFELLKIWDKKIRTGEEIEGRGLVSYYTLWMEAKEKNAELYKQVIALEQTKENKFKEGYEAGLEDQIEKDFCPEIQQIMD